MGNQSQKMPPTLVLIDGELFHEFDQWRKLQSHRLQELDGTDGWMLRLTRGTPDDRDAQ